MIGTEGHRRWHRTQRFALSTAGAECEAEYRSKIVASREEVGRASYDAARSAWAVAYALQPDDGLYLGEVRSGPMSLGEMVESLDTCGKTHGDALAALDRLVARGLITAVAKP